jgi:hypothetical protein
MKISVQNYPDFKLVVDSFGAGLRNIYYSRTGSNTVASALAVYFSRDQYVEITVPGATPEATLLADFPNAILTGAAVSGSY